MPLPQSYWPKKKLGELSPTNTVTEYEWYYFSIPRGVSTVALPVGMEEFTPKEIQHTWHFTRYRGRKRTDATPLLFGPEFLQRFRCRRMTGQVIGRIAVVLRLHGMAPKTDEGTR